MGAGGMAGDSGIVMEDVCEGGMWNLGGRLVSMLMRAGILVGGVVVVVAVGGIISVKAFVFWELLILFGFILRKEVQSKVVCNNVYVKLFKKQFYSIE